MIISVCLILVASGTHLTAQALDLDPAPTWAETGRITGGAGYTGAAEGAGPSFGFFGSALDLDGSLAVAGTAVDTCDMFTTVHLYRTSTGTEWSEVAELVPSDGEYGDAFEDCSAFGNAVALDRQAGIVAAGNPAYEKPGTGNADHLDGAVYIFERSEDGSWTETLKLEGPDDRGDRLGAEFGRSIDIDGTTLVVGAPFEDRGPDLREAGAVYVLTRDDGDWNSPVRLVPEAPIQNAQFGLDVALNGDLIAIGAPTERTTGGDGAMVGAAYVFQRGADGAWSQIGHLTPPDIQDVVGLRNGCFGTQLDLDGSTLVIADACWAPLGDGSAHLGNNGQVYVYEGTEDGWILNDELGPLGGMPGSAYGGAVGIEDGTIVVGAPWEGHPARTGGAYVFQDGLEGWTERARLTANDTSPGDHFGWAADTSDGRIIVSAPFDDNRQDGLPPPADDEGDVPGVGVDNGEEMGTVYVFEPRSGSPLLP